ncbi:unnamed protein product [Bursaphelenchus okinawaensis]|uniref:Uncharacterized protein n=1 Tax=Bursaphelenchus okinawaensis TaxID=465554 RepID=A0A811LP41_9BILA|nr:unnamed protein product [Bursaphelenchus okinawaensis]CAG9126915.1 unnamed protein product [Bursaphelenchus okinawaensis]
MGVVSSSSVYSHTKIDIRVWDDKLSKPNSPPRPYPLAIDCGIFFMLATSILAVLIGVSMKCCDQSLADIFIQDGLLGFVPVVPSVYFLSRPYTFKIGVVQLFCSLQYAVGTAIIINVYHLWISYGKMVDSRLVTTHCMFVVLKYFVGLFVQFTCLPTKYELKSSSGSKDSEGAKKKKSKKNSSSKSSKKKGKKDGKKQKLSKEEKKKKKNKKSKSKKDKSSKTSSSKRSSKSSTSAVSKTSSKSSGAIKSSKKSSQSSGSTKESKKR